jgi:dipeptidyl aminopeptidase/acylaminoacyl peptidase
MMRTLLAAGLLSLFCFAASLSAQEQPAASTTPGVTTLTPEASLTLRSISDLQFSSDGMRAAVVVTEPPKGERRARHIWIYEKQSGAVRQFTYSAKTESSPRWSPDGKQLAFLSNRDGDDQQIYLMRSDGGEAAAITKGKRSVANFAWSPDGKQIAFLAPDAKTEAEEKKEKDKDDARVADKDDKHARLWLLNVPAVGSTTASTVEPKALTPSNWELRELAWLPSGDRLVVAATDHPESDQETNRIFTVQVSDGSMKQIAAPRGPFGELRVSPDGKTVSYLGCREDGPVPHDLMLLDLGTRAARNLTGASLDRPIGEYQWKKDGSLVGLLADGFHNKFFAFTSAGVLQDAPPAFPTNPSAFAVSGSGEILFAAQTATQPQELWSWDGKDAPSQVSHLNDSWKKFTLSPLEAFKYKSFGGVEIEAGLLRPSAAAGGKPLPLIALIHGGPTGNWEDGIDTWGQLLAARGFAVFYPNVRGSIGYGEKFMEMNRGDWGGGDFKDVMAGIDDLVARGIADPNKLGIGGWSYGGYMSEWAITQTTRFKAAVSGAGLANLISEYGTEKGPSYDEWFYGVPYEPEKVAGFLNSSPFVHLKNAKTPTLILQGDADDVDPLGQSQELYRGLKRYGVEAELVVYPREPHGFHEEKHLLDRLNRILAWYDKHLK